MINKKNEIYKRKINYKLLKFVLILSYCFIVNINSFAQYQNFNVIFSETTHANFIRTQAKWQLPDTTYYNVEIYGCRVYTDRQINIERKDFLSHDVYILHPKEVNGNVLKFNTPYRVCRYCDDLTECGVSYFSLMSNKQVSLYIIVVDLNNVFILFVDENILTCLQNLYKNNIYYNLNGKIIDINDYKGFYIYNRKLYLKK